MPPERVVLDVNVILAHAISNNLQSLLINVSVSNLEIFSCEELIDELTIALSYPHVNKFLQKNSEERIVSLFRRASTLIGIDLRYDGFDDIKDNYLMDLAYTAKADYLVSGDRKVLSKKHVGKIQIISPAQFKKLLKA